MPRRRRIRFVQAGMLSIVVSAMEMAAALAIAVLLGLVLNPGDTPEFPVVGDVRELVPGAEYDELVIGTCAVFAVLFVLRAALYLFQQYATAKVMENTAVLLSDRLVGGYLSMPYEWHLRRNSAELVRNSWDNVQQVSNGVFVPMANIVSETVLALAMLTVLLTTSVLLTGVAAVVLGLTLVVTLAAVQPKLKRLGRRRQAAAKDALQALQQAFGGVRDLKILGREDAFASRFRRSRFRMARAVYLRSALSHVPRVFLELAFLSLLLLGVVIATIQNEVDSLLATLGVFAYAGLRLQPSLQKVSQSLNSIRFAEAAVEDLSDGLGLLDRSTSERVRDDASDERLDLRDGLEFDRVSYSYPGTTTTALADVELAVPAGSSLGVVGATGGGKSTFLDLLCGLLRPSAGRILVDGQDVSSATRAWQRGLGVVHQASFLVDDTIRRNVALGVPDRDIDDRQVERCLDIAQLTDVVDELEDGVDTVVGERGIRLSGGQRQRITVARALYREPSVLVLDEGTASLDNETERRLIERLRDVGDLTLVMVAHRLTTIEDCEQIIMLDGGRIVARGTYDQLLTSNDDFRVLASRPAG